ncbi:MAG: MFS transporter [Acidobacteriota bacterium]|jgi:UMF1 family MFS transporter
MTTPRSAPPVRPREIFGWAMFDFANSSYTTIVVTVAFGNYFTTLVAPGPRGDALWGLAITVSNAAVMLLSVVVGAMADGAARKKAFLFASYLLCVLGTAGLWFATPGRVVLALTLFVASNVAFSLGENFTSSFLPELSTPKTIGRISGFGWGLGYVGGLLSLAAIVPLVSGDFVPENLGNLRLVWVVNAAFFLLAGLPTFLLLRERAVPTPGRSWAQHAGDGLLRVVETVREIRHFGQLARFLVVFFLFQAGLTTMFAFAGIYAVQTIGFSGSDLISLFLVLNVSAAVGALGFGFVQDRIGVKRTIQITLAGWIVVCAAAYLTHTAAQFWGVATLAGLGIGSLQSAARAMVGLFAPVEKSGELFGFWGLAGKGAYATGPLVFGLVSSATGSQRVAILATGGFFVLGLVGMAFVDEGAGRRAAEEWDRRERRGDRDAGSDVGGGRAAPA